MYGYPMVVKNTITIPVRFLQAFKPNSFLTVSEKKKREDVEVQYSNASNQLSQTR